MTTIHNFHVTMNDFVDNVNDIDNKKFKHLCFLFTGKLNYFGSLHWEKYALRKFKHVYDTTRDENIKITFKFVAYETDGNDTRPNFGNRILSGYGDIYSELFTEIKNCIDVYKFKNESLADNDEVRKFNEISYWLQNTKLDNSVLKKNDFEHYCKSVFGFADAIEFYYVDSSNITQLLQLEFNDSTIISPGVFGQHLQVGNAYQKYPDMFSDCNIDTLIFKTRYDAVIKSSQQPYYMMLPNTFNKLYNLIYHDETMISSLPFNYFKVVSTDEFDNAPLVFYTRAFAAKTKKLYIHFMPDDLLLVFNTAGIKSYAKNYNKWLVNFRKSIYNDNDSGGVGLNIHTSLGKFFLDNSFNTIDYTPYNHLEPLDLFGLLLRYADFNVIDDDVDDDYKLRWYHGQWAIRSKIIERFGKRDNT